MNVVDSSGWIEYLSGGANAEYFRAAIEDAGALIVPTLSLVEVYRRLLGHAGRDEALQVFAAVRQATVVVLDDRLALAAAELGVAMRLAMAGSAMLTTAQTSARPSGPKTPTSTGSRAFA